MIAIYLDNDFEFQWNGQRRNTSTGELEPAIGLTLTARLSATDGGAAIAGALSKSLTERVGTPGEYFAIVEGDDLRTNLSPTYVGQVVYEVFGDGTNVLFSVPRRVVERRRA